MTATETSYAFTDSELGEIRTELEERDAITPGGAFGLGIPLLTMFDTLAFHAESQEEWDMANLRGELLESVGAESLLGADNEAYDAALSDACIEIANQHLTELAQQEAQLGQSVVRTPEQMVAELSFASSMPIGGIHEMSALEVPAGSLADWVWSPIAQPSTANPPVASVGRVVWVRHSTALGISESVLDEAVASLLAREQETKLQQVYSSTAVCDELLQTDLASIADALTDQFLIDRDITQLMRIADAWLPCIEAVMPYGHLLEGELELAGTASILARATSRCLRQLWGEAAAAIESEGDRESARLYWNAVVLMLALIYGSHIDGAEGAVSALLDRPLAAAEEDGAIS